MQIKLWTSYNLFTVIYLHYMYVQWKIFMEIHACKLKIGL